MFKCKNKNAIAPLKRVRVRAEDRYVYDEGCRWGTTQDFICVEVRCGNEDDDWVAVREVKADDPELDDKLVQYVSEAEEKAGIIGAWKPSDKNVYFSAKGNKIVIRVKCGKRWVKTETVAIHDPNFEDKLGEAVCSAQHRAAVIGAWT